MRNRRLHGLKFRRQHVLYGFIADFYCPALSLVLEIDGTVHTTPSQIEYDRQRTTILEGHGLTVIRVKNEDVNEAALSRLVSQALSGREDVASPPNHQRASPLSRSPGEGDRG